MKSDTPIRMLQHRSNNAYDSILLIGDGLVIGAWTVGVAQSTGRDPIDDYNNPGDLSDWEPNWPDATDPADYGDLVSQYSV